MRTWAVSKIPTAEWTTVGLIGSHRISSQSHRIFIGSHRHHVMLPSQLHEALSMLDLGSTGDSITTRYPVTWALVPQFLFVSNCIHRDTHQSRHTTPHHQLK
ncbi:hypothetical protein BDW67DRAFT_19408 [Aspergillus spinulosporus]